MTKTDAEQHSAVWGLVDKFITQRMEEAHRDRIEVLTSDLLALSYLANYVARGYMVLAESIESTQTKDTTNG